MKKLLVNLFLGLFLMVSSAHAAPGDLLYQWGKAPLFNFPQVIASDRSGNIYVGDEDSLQVFNSSGARLHKWAQTGGATAVDADGYIYRVWSDGVKVYDRSGFLVRKWQTCDGMLGCPMGIAISPGGNVFVSDPSGRVQVFDKTGRLLQTIGRYGTGDGELNYPTGLAFDGSGRLYVMDSYGLKVNIFDPAGQFLGKWGASGNGIAVGGNGNIYIAGAQERVMIYDSAGTVRGELHGSGEVNGTFIGPWTVAVGAGGRVYVPDLGNRVQIFDADGNFLTKWGSSGSGDREFDYPKDSALDENGNLYVADSNNHRIQVLSGTGTCIRKWGTFGTGDGEFNTPQALALSRDGSVYVADSLNNRIQVFDKTGAFLRKWQSPSPSGLALDDAGNLYTVDSAGSFVYVYDGMGNLLRQWGGATDEQIGAPGRIAIDAMGKVYLTDRMHGRINVYDRSGNFLTELGGASLMWPSGIAVDGGGNLYVTDTAYSRLFALDGEGNERGAEGYFGSRGLSFINPAAVAVDGAGTRIFVSDSGNNRITVLEGFGDRLPAGWTGSDIGTIGRSGRSSYANGAFTLLGSGAAMGGEWDDFRYTYKALAGDGEIVARVTGVQNTNGYARGGIMIRDGIWPYASYVMLAITPAYGAEFLSCNRNWPPLRETKATAVAAPYWVKLVRQGNAFSGYLSRDGVTWSLVGASVIEMPKEAYAGLVAHSHTNSALCTVTMDGVSLYGQTSTPTVRVTAPADGATFSEPATVAITANATAGAYATVAQVEFLAGSTSIGTATAAPYTVTWKDVAPGRYSVTAKVTDSLGMTSTSTPVVFTVNPGSLADKWLTQDIGSVGAPGSAAYLNGVFTIKGSGADIWSTADAFRYVYQRFTGDMQIVARVASVQNTNGYAKGGVMIRETLAANSSHAMMDVTPSRGAEFSRRISTGGTTSATVTAGITAPYWVKLVRKGSTFTGSISLDGVDWLQVASSTIPMAGSVYVGLVANSHNSALCTVTVDSVSVTLPGDTSPPKVTSFAIPASSSSLTVSITTLTASDNVGVTGYLLTESAVQPSGAASGWSGSKPVSYTFATAGSKRLYAWAKDAAGNISGSLAASVTVSAGSLPVPWLTQDIGSVETTGSASYLNGTFTLSGSGADIYGSTDAFRFVYKTMTGDGEIVARVASLQNSNPYAKAGVMMRQSLGANSIHAMMDLWPIGGAEFSRRLTAGGPTAVTATAGFSPPYWVKLVRTGNYFSGYVSYDGSSWLHVASASLEMSSTVYVGLVVSSHSMGLAGAVFDGVR